jgi:glyoxylase-like metal-dependent hydrolase (beta-lactamase superfamily II)
MRRLTVATVIVACVAGAHTQSAVRSLHVQGNVWMLHSDVVNAAVQIGDDGVLVVDTMDATLADPLLAEISRLAPGKPIRIIVNTHIHPDHTGGNAKVAAAGSSVIGGNAVAQIGQAAANRAQVYAHENVEARMAQTSPGQAATPTELWPSDTFTELQHDIYFNGEGIELLHQPEAHTDGDTMVYFRKSDVLVAGDIYTNERFPMVDFDNGGSLTGIVTALNTIIKITIPREKQEGGTYVIPGHGRLADEADIVEYRDMTTILRDRVADAVKRRMTLDQIKAAQMVRDYDGRYGAKAGWSTDHFIEAAYRSVAPKPAASSPGGPEKGRPSPAGGRTGDGR